MTYLQAGLRASAAGAALALGVASLSACESNQTYGAARVGIRLDANDQVEILTYACGNALPSTIKVSPVDEESSLWRATSTQAHDGLVVVPADGRTIEGWAVAGSADPHSPQPRVAWVYLGPGIGWQTHAFTATQLSHDRIAVGPESYAGSDAVTEAEFIRVNQDWCSRGR